MRRLFEDPEQPQALREELQRSRAAGQDYPAEAKLMQLQAALADASRQPLAGSPGSIQRLVATHPGWKLAIVVVAVGAGVAALLYRPVSQAPEPSDRAALQPKPSEPAVPASAPETPTEPAPAQQPSAAAVDPAPAPAPPAKSSRREIAQLVRIRALLARDPAAAQRLAQRSEQEFPSGLLSEERQALSIIALAKTGARERAAVKARAFFARFPQTPMRGRIEAELGRDPR